jgi:hypothetical protein
MVRAAVVVAGGISLSATEIVNG